MPDLGAALPLFERLTGATASPAERVEAQRVDVAFLETGAAGLEVIAPSDPDSPVARFLARRGPGLHHVALRVPALEPVLRDLAAAGVRLIDAEPRAGAHGRRIAFLHPESCGGVLVELVEGPLNGRA